MIRPMFRHLTVLLALLGALGAAAAPASAASRDQIIRDCSDDGRLQGKYSASELRDARQNLPSDVSEYTDCADVLRRAELPDRGSGAGAGGGAAGGGSSFGGGSGTGGGGQTLTPSSDAERKTLAEIAESGAAPVEVNGRTVVPGAAGFSPNASRSNLPGTLLIAIVAMALLGIGGIVAAVRASGLPSAQSLIPGRRA